MINHHSPLFDPARLAALRRTKLLDSPPARAFDRLTQLASQLLKAPVAVVSLVDDTSQFFKSHTGLDGPWATRRETPLSHSFCRHVVEGGVPLIVNDARQHPQVRDNPAVSALNVAAYAGIPLRTPDGHTLGSFCVIDRQPRDWQPGEIGLLSELAESVIAEISLQNAVNAQQELLDRLALWFARTPLACFMCGPDLRISDWSPSAERIFGHARTDAVGQLPHELLFAPAFRDEAEAEFRSLAVGETSSRKTLECLDRNRRAVFAEWTLTPLCKSNGGTGGFIAMVEDVTAAHRAAKERAALEAQLCQKQKMESLGTLAGGIAHEFNNILGAILGNAELARQDLISAHRACESIEGVIKASRRARDLVEQILAFARGQPLQRRVIALAPVLEESVKLLRATLPREVDFTATCAHNTPPVLADATQVEETIVNLVTNAWQALDHQPGRITLAIASAEVGPTADPGLRPGRYATITVTDTGRGMDKATLDRIFDPFFTTKRVGEGTGLGLSIVHGIMEQHGGSVRAVSVPERGSTFTLYFPAAAEPLSELSEKSEPPPVPGGAGRRIWFLDDEEALTLIARRALESLGYMVSPFTHVDTALGAFEAEPNSFDLAVTDYHMPAISGLQVAGRLRKLRPDLPVLLISGCITPRLRDEASRVGIAHLLQKPHTLGELGDAIGALLKSQQSIPTNNAR